MRRSIPPGHAARTTAGVPQLLQEGRQHGRSVAACRAMSAVCSALLTQPPKSCTRRHVGFPADPPVRDSAPKHAGCKQLISFRGNRQAKVTSASGRKHAVQPARCSMFTKLIRPLHISIGALVSFCTLTNSIRNRLGIAGNLVIHGLLLALLCTVGPTASMEGKLYLVPAAG